MDSTWVEHMFRDPQVVRDLMDKGFAVRDLLTAADIDRLTASYHELRALDPHELGEQFWPSGRHESPELRDFARRSIEAVVPARLEGHLHMEHVRFIGGTYLVKPPGDESALNPHQDSSHVDERHGFSVYAWIPLSDVDVENGCVHYLPGSHTWGIDQRSLNVPWPLGPVEMDLWPEMVPIPLRAGQVLFFHSALIHASTPNRTDEVRVALNYYLHPAGHPFCHFYTDETLAPGTVEMFSVTPDFYYLEDFERRPDPTRYELLETLPISEPARAVHERLARLA